MVSTMSESGVQMLPVPVADSPNWDAPEANGKPHLAEDAPAQSFSCLQGPRDFQGATPKQLCSLWLRHPALCGEGDACAFAHGLMELGLDVRAAVKLQTGSDESPVSVQPVVAQGKAPTPLLQLLKGARAAQGKGAGFGKAAQGKGGGVGVGATPYGKSGKASATLALPASAKGLPPSAKGKPSSSSRFGAGGFMPAKLCQFWVENPQSCAKGETCSFAHGVHELKPGAAAACGVSRFLHSSFAPTQMCQFFAQGACTKGMLCTYAHSADELRQ